ncbi:Glycosyltransferase WbsX [Chitinophaga jiangningensis]|uniref:Glycosyltransferase WbsX n=1 Tax=Chitinophaga jiangningensis TaxID=1419482 RepID=A0A1M7MAF1_9BACT|nr:glycoside hydrolase family 99-like domain-containing protein [Chitinophaga jiangningensis]SHM87292.1 Glycosyltransferase WbsX [Chitinophaga jiangningensis]
MRYIHLVLIVALMAGACKKELTGPGPEGSILNYEIPEVPVTQDYTVGAFYTSFGGWNANIKEVPVAGKYAMPAGVIPPEVMAKHIDYAVKGGVDYFVFSFRSPNRDATNYRSDSTLIRGFQHANGEGKMQFAVAYNFSTGTYGGISAGNPIEKDKARLTQFFEDFHRIVPLLTSAGYQQVDGKPILYILNAQTLFSDNNKAIYDTLRSKFKEWGVTPYLVGMQDRWTPPARYQIRFDHCVDAIIHQSFSSQNNNWDRFYLLPQVMDQNWQYSKKYFADTYAADYIPNITPAHTWLIGTPTSTNPEYSRKDSGALFTKLCNVAKLNASEKTRLIMIDSWNNWNEDTQLEPAVSYGELYLNIVRKQFKK